MKEKMQKTDDQLIKSQCLSLSPCNEEFNEMSKPCTKVLSPLPVRAKGRLLKVVRHQNARSLK
ncbi:hypothetical protein ACSBR2_016010 [Camellia fascicularis]